MPSSPTARPSWTRRTAIPPGSTRGPWPWPASPRTPRIPPAAASSAIPRRERRQERCGRAPRASSKSSFPRLGPADYIKGLKAGLALANRFGIASIIEASAGPELLDAYAALDRTDELSVRVVASLHVDTRRGVPEVARLAGLRRRYAGTAAQGDHGQDLRRRGHGASHGRPPRAPYVDRPGDRGTAASRARGVRRAGPGARPGRLPDPRPRHRRPGRPHVARRLRGGRAGQRLSGHAPPHRPPRAHRSRRHPALQATRRRGQLPGPLGLRRYVHHRPDPAHPRPRTVALALSDRERRPDRGRHRRRERLVGLLHEPARRPSRSR